MTRNSINTLIEADRLLDSISVKGNDVYLLVEARQLLKTVFNDLKRTEENKDGSEN